MTDQPSLFPPEDAEAEQAALLERMTRDAESIRPCRACQAKLWFIRTKTGALCPYDASGNSHYRTCTHPELFSRDRKEGV
jgi:hypothetical protein